VDVKNVRYCEGRPADDLEVYGGPTFDTLDEELQEAFYSYLEERGINDDFSYFLLSYGAQKEQREYQHWLKKLHEFTK
jgi:complement component 1 Q subcomponent-binding protein, mitochondrial